MGIKQQRLVTVYVTGTGREIEVSKMTPEHLVNALAYHLKQSDALDEILDAYHPADGDGFLLPRKLSICSTIQCLADELSLRDPKRDYEPKDEQKPIRYTTNPWRNRK